MRCYFDYNGATPDGVRVVREGSTVRVFFDYTTVTRKDAEGNDVTSLACENVDAEGSGYGDIVNAVVRDRYPSDRYEAVMANHQDAEDAESPLTDEKRAEYRAEYEAFRAWRRRAKEVAAAAVAAMTEG